jgi:hypothetical protein
MTVRTMGQGRSRESSIGRSSRVALVVDRARRSVATALSSQPETDPSIASETYEVNHSMVLSIPAESTATPAGVELELALFAYLREFHFERGLAHDDVAALAVRKQLYSVWDDPALAHDHAPRQSEDWPQVVCKEGSD